MAKNNVNTITDAGFQFRVNAYTDYFLDDKSNKIEDIHGWAVTDAVLTDGNEDEYNPGIYLGIIFEKDKQVTVVIPEEELWNMLIAVRELKARYA